MQGIMAKVYAELVAEKQGNFRPATLATYIGDDRIKELITCALRYSRLDHVKFPHAIAYGQAGLGKTTLARLIANECNVPLIEYVGADLKKRDQLDKLLTVGAQGAVVFIDEIHSVPKEIMEVLYMVMEDGKLAPSEDSGTFTYLNPITVIGATTELQDIPTPLLDRFPLRLELRPYSDFQMGQIVHNMITAQASAYVFNGMYTEEFKEASEYIETTIADLSRGVPRHAASLISNIKMIVPGFTKGEPCTPQVLAACLFGVAQMAGSSYIGLTKAEILMLKYLLRNGEAGAANIASAIGENKKTVERKMEPYLMLRGLICKNYRGRAITRDGYLALLNAALFEFVATWQSKYMRSDFTLSWELDTFTDKLQEDFKAELDMLVALAQKRGLQDFNDVSNMFQQSNEVFDVGDIRLKFGRPYEDRCI